MVSDGRVDLKLIEGRGPAEHEPSERPDWARRPGEPAVKWVGADQPAMRPEVVQVQAKQDEIALLLGCSIVDEVHVSRKQYLDEEILLEHHSGCGGGAR